MQVPCGQECRLNGNATRLTSRIGQGLVLAAAIAAGAWKAHALTTSGAAAATFVGAAVHAGMGYRGSAAMVAYFASTSALGRLPRQGSSTQHRGDRRDAVQVLANGGPPAFCALVHAWSAASAKDLAAMAFYGSLAAAAADTWATEFGSRFGGRPRSVATGQVVSPGESGAVSIVGLAASAVASAAIALTTQVGKDHRPSRSVSCFAGGMTGSLADSLLGAHIQEQRWCEQCGVRTELKAHSCGNSSTHQSGLHWVNNDVVNVSGVIVGALTADALFAVLPHLTGHDGSRVEFATTATNSRMPEPTGSP